MFSSMSKSDGFNTGVHLDVKRLAGEPQFFVECKDILSDSQRQEIKHDTSKWWGRHYFKPGVMRGLPGPDS